MTLPSRLDEKLYHDWLLPDESREVRSTVRCFVDSE